jgi:hypothetical protein
MRDDRAVAQRALEPRDGTTITAPRRKIGETVGVIDIIAFETRIVASNAAVKGRGEVVPRATKRSRSWPE